VGLFFLTVIITIMEDLGLFFLATINIISGGIYLRNSSLTKDEISALWSLLACYTSNLSLLP
jgi:hypothetical protein